MKLTDEQWERIAPLLPVGRSGPGKKGRPRRDDREILDGILWILRTGAPWKDLPDEHPPRNTCHRRMQDWVGDGTFERVLEALSRDLKERGGLDLSEAFIDGTFSPAKKGALASALPSAAKEPRSWQWSTAMVFRSPLVSKALRRMK